MEAEETRSKWTLHIGCHSGTYMSRDCDVRERDSLEECRESVRSSEEFWASRGYYVWYAYAISPDGKRIELHEGTSYR